MSNERGPTPQHSLKRHQSVRANTINRFSPVTIQPKSLISNSEEIDLVEMDGRENQGRQTFGPEVITTASHASCFHLLYRPQCKTFGQ